MPRISSLPINASSEEDEVHTFEFTGGTIQAKPNTKPIWPGYPTPVLTFNGSIPGPTIRVRKGERFTARIQNGLAEALVLHWHGILAPADMDGNPRDAVPPGAAYHVDFPVHQPGHILDL